MNLFGIPEEVFFHDIWPYLEWNDLLRFRRVCKRANDLILGFIRNRPDRAPELEINETTKSWAEFLKMGIPTTKVFINNNKGPFFFDKDRKVMSAVLDRYGPLIKDLRIFHLSQCLFGNESAFFDKIPNLKVLMVHDWIGNLPSRQKQNGAKKFMRQFRSAINDITGNTCNNGELFPKVFKNLQRLEINLQGEWVNLGVVVAHTMYITKCCSQAEEISVPFSSQVMDTGFLYQKLLRYPPDQHFLVLAAFFRNLNADLNKQSTLVQQASTKIPLKMYSFKNFYFDDQHTTDARLVEMHASSDFLELCETCMLNGIKLEMVNAYWFEYCKVFQCKSAGLDPRDLGKCVTSMVNLHPSVITDIDMPNLEKLVIMSTSRTCIATGTSCRSVWPSLQILDVTVNSPLMDKATQVIRVNGDQVEFTTHSSIETASLFGFLFCHVIRPKLGELNLTFDIWLTLPRLASVIVSSCPNLKKLSLKNWTGTNKALTKFWSGLPGLEEIILDGCTTVGNVAFVGEDVQNPVFLQLKRLKKLSFLQLDKMPKISDTLFRLVLCHLRLTHLTLTSGTPIKTITPDGVRALRQGKFAQSIERFPFTGWSLDSCSKKKHSLLSKEFRSYRMI